MRLIKKTGVWDMFRRETSLIITDEKTLDNIIEDPSKPLLDKDNRGFSMEKRSLYDEKTTLLDICRKGKENKAEQLAVSYDFFFGGSKRENYPDSEKTIKAFKIIHDTAKEYGMGFSASIVSPLDIGGGYARKHENTGFTYQFAEGAIKPDGTYSIPVTLQTQWLNNKGPIQLKLEKVMVFAFNEERIEDTNLFYVDPNDIRDISDTAQYEIDEESIHVSFNGYGSGNMRVFGKTSEGNRYSRCMAVMIYRTPELDYFAEDALDYMKGIIDLHHKAGISYTGFYSDEMHIQFDWDLFNHFGENEINTRYVSRGLKDEYARRYGEEYRDFEKYMIYFAYHQHDFLDGEEGREASQHVFGKDEKSIYETWLFRKRYFEMLQRQVVDLCVKAKEYAEELFGGPIHTKAHSTWQESPTCDRFYKEALFSEWQRGDISRYDYTPSYYWSSSIRENIAACYDYFKWNDFLTGGGTDHPEGGFADRNYYSQAFACSLAVLNKTPIAYNGSWGSPKEVLRRIRNVGTAYGNLTNAFEHNLVQGLTSRETDVLAIYPLDLNYVEERFGSWMVQYGYCNYITEDKILEEKPEIEDGHLVIRGRKYRALVILFSPFIRPETLDLIRKFVENRGKVLWTSVYPLEARSNPPVLGDWMGLFGIKSIQPAYRGYCQKDEMVKFENSLSGVEDMPILTDMLPDYLYPVQPAEGAEVVAKVKDMVVGVAKKYSSGGTAVYLGFRPRDDQSCSTGRDVSTLFSVLVKLGAYKPDGCEIRSRRSDSRYLMNRFPNGSVSITNHYRTFYEEWDGKFFRDEDEDRKALAGRKLPPVEIDLTDTEIGGNRITYSGMDVLTYRLDENNRLVGFAGSSTTGISINGKEYSFVETPTNVVWTEIAREHLTDEVARLFVVKIDLPGEVRLPLPIDSPEDYSAGLCGDSVYEVYEPVKFRYENDCLILNIDEGTAGKWIAVYKKN